MTISSVILSKNNQEKLPKLLKSLEWCDEIIVVDDNSTPEIAKLVPTNQKVKIYKHSLKDDFAAQRNFGLAKANSDWVLFIDSDEVVDQKLAEEIQKAITHATSDGFLIKRIDHWLGKELANGDLKPYLLRLGRKGAGKWKRRVHETWDIIDIEKLDNPIHHTPHESVSEFLSDINYYSSLHSQEVKKVSFAKILLFPIGKFMVNFFLKSGFKDGTHGFVISVLMSFHSFLAWNKSWTKQN